MEEGKAISPSVGGGALYRYADGTGTRITVFIYPIPPQQLTSAPQQALVRVKDAFVQGLAEGVRRGWYDDYKVADDVAVGIQTARGNIPGLAVLVAASAKNQGLVEAFYIFAIDSSFVKVRATMPITPATKPRLRYFVEELVTTLSARALAPDSGPQAKGSARGVCRRDRAYETGMPAAGSWPEDCVASLSDC